MNKGLLTAIEALVEISEHLVEWHKKSEEAYEEKLKKSEEVTGSAGLERMKGVCFKRLISSIYAQRVFQHSTALVNVEILKALGRIEERLDKLERDKR